MPAGALVIWWVTLVVAVVVVLPLAWYLLHRVWLAARAVERYARETLEAGVGIARHTAAVAALEQTVAAAGALVAGAEAIARHAGEIEAALGRRTLRGGA